MEVSASHDIGQALAISGSFLESYDFHKFKFLGALYFVFCVCALG